MIFNNKNQNYFDYENPKKITHINPLPLLGFLFPVSKAVWDQLVRLYPCLVRCVPYTQQCCSSPQVTDSLTEALLQYGDLLLKAPPSTAADAQQQ